jgi:hypothetical protein
MAAAVPCASSEDNITDNEITSKDSYCKKCSDLETRLQEALKELSSAHFIKTYLEMKPSHLTIFVRYYDLANPQLETDVS